jgi:hypothetical protein
MRHMIPVFAAMFSVPLLDCILSTWFLVQPPVMLFVPSDARDVRVSELGFGQRLLTYRTSSERYQWYVTVATRLTARDWQPPEPWEPSAQSGTYLRVTPLWLGLLWEQAELHGEPHQARIILRRWLTLSWQPRYADK